MGNIVLLDDLTINKIAAGEVIERPASVIKEMVENSIDAGANNITVEIKNGGISYIRVTDNGKGIPEDDLEIAFERHATSKIRSAEDLSTVTSMGFRGEALASIAAIARVELVSKTANQENGFKVVVEGGNVLEKSEAGCSTGTSITVTNLFYNTPVRYKFLKKDFTEAGYIEDAVTRIALVHPEIAIKLINSGKTVIQTNGNGDLKTVIYSIYGKDVAGALIETEYTYEDMHIYGVVGKPEIARSNRANQIFFVNKRFVKDKALTSAAEKAYKGMIPIGKFSFLVLNVDMNPAKVDVNVHPAKLEVRFEEENTVFKAVYHAIRDALLKAELVADTEQTSSESRAESGLFGNRTQVGATSNNIQMPNFGSTMNNMHKPNFASTSNNMQMPNIQKSQEVLRKLQEMKEKLMQEKMEAENKYTYNTEETKEEVVQVAEETVEYNYNENPAPIPEFVSESVVAPELITETEPNVEEMPKVEAISEVNEMPKVEEIPEVKEIQEKVNIIEDIINNPVTENTASFEEMYLKFFGTKPVEEQTQEEPKDTKQNADDIATLGNTSMFENIEEFQKPTYKFIGIVFNTYIIIEIDKEMYILDQHAAHERILYEKVKANYYNDEAKDSQLMLLPDIITLSHKEMEIAKDNMQMFRKAGFILEEFGENTIKLTGVPEMCIDLETKEMFLETLDEINSVSRTAKQEVEERFIATVACKAAVKANMALTKEEVDSLMNKLLALPNPFTCPHGRPTAIKMSKYDIERKFARA